MANLVNDIGYSITLRYLQEILGITLDLIPIAYYLNGAENGWRLFA
jgi:hypothetical protein